MLTQTGSPEDADAALQVAERLERICVDLLRVARGENTEKVVTAVDAGVAILECAERWSDVCARRGVDIKWINSNLRAACDADDLDVCLDEFVANALDATPENGAAISLSAREVENHKGRFVQFDVVDHGDGVGPESLVRVFEPFYRIQHDRDSIGGTGLGLSVVKTVAQRYAGEAVLESSRDQNGENTTVASLLLPMA
jgi:two-component system OmpR family sensor kinase